MYKINLKGKNNCDLVFLKYNLEKSKLLSDSSLTFYFQVIRGIRYSVKMSRPLFSLGFMLISTISKPKDYFR